MFGILLKSLAVIGAVGWDEFLADLHMQFLERARSPTIATSRRRSPTLVRRMTLVFTPLFWVTAGYHVIRAIRAPTLSFAVKDTAMWLLLPAIAFLYVFRQLATSQMRRPRR